MSARLDDDLSQLDDEQLAAWQAELDAAEAAEQAKPVDLGAAASWYARVAGWPVFPLVPRGKIPLTPRGFHDATRDRATIVGWWRRWPTANIGTPTGRTFSVVDIDGPDGFRSLADLADRPGGLPPVLARTYTGSGGRHVLVGPDPRLRQGARLLPGVDVRALGGYVVVPPSVHPSGRRYIWLDRPQGWPR